MMHDRLSEEYFTWMCDKVKPSKKRYSKLMETLHRYEFTFILDMDGNRAEEGICLRYRFGAEKGYDQRLIANLLDDRPCSVLEMLVALSIYCEEHIMFDFESGDQTAQWFWNMIQTMELSEMDDSSFDKREVFFKIGRFLKREYEPNGKGGLFYIPNNDSDMRKIDIWCQMMWYLDWVLNYPVRKEH